MGEFGDKFRKAREKKEISLDDVSNVTKISSRMLRAIEEEHFDQLPGGVFNKGFIRAYAKHLGLDAEEAVTEYLACLRQAQIDAHEVWEPEPATGQTLRRARSISASSSSRQNRRELQHPCASRRTPRPATSARRARSFRAKRFWRNLHSRYSLENHCRRCGRHRLGRDPLGPSLPPRKGLSATVGAANPATIPTPVANAPQPAPVNPSPVKPPSKPAPSRPLQAPKSQPPQITHPAAAVSTPNSPIVTESNDVTTRTFGKPVIAPPAKSAAPLTLVIRAQETSWISVQADGQQVSQETLIAPAHASIRAGHEIVARIGNAAGVTFVFNGQEIPANGAESEVKTFIFDANGVRVAPTAPLPAQDH